MLNTKLLNQAFTEYREVCELLCVELNMPCHDKDFAKIAFPGCTTEGSVKKSFSKFMAKIGRGDQVTTAEATNVLSAHRDMYRTLLQKKAEAYGHASELDLDAETIECESKIRRKIHLPELVADPDAPAKSSFLHAGSFIVRDNDVDTRTRSLEIHDREPFRSYAHDLKFDAPVSGDAYLALCKKADAQFVKQRPDTAELSAFKVLSDSSLFDHADWVAVPDAEDIQTRPIQMCYCTRVVEVEFSDAPPKEIGFEFNTGGFGVFPLPDVIGPGAKRPRVLMQRNTRMVEMPHSSEGRVTYLMYSIPPELAGQTYEFVNRCIYINGLQDQYHLENEDGHAVETDWSGKRVTPNSLNQDLAVILPETYGIDSWYFAKRPERVDRDQRVEIDQRERCFQPGPQRPGSELTGGKAIWFIPDKVKEPTIFSFQWSWDWK